MSVNDFLRTNLICPKTGESLKKNANAWTSSVANYPWINGVPWLFADPDNAWRDWSRKIHDFIDNEQLYLKHLQARLNAGGASLANKRLTQQQQARSKNLAWVKTILVDFKRPDDSIALPSTQQIYSYFQLFFRDWCWGMDELDYYVQYCLSKIPSDTQSVLLLGSGAGGLSYYLASARADTCIVSIEHNPLLALGAQRLLSGKSFKLADYSAYPIDLDHASKTWEVKAPRLAHDNHRILLCSFPNLPFSARTFDVVIAPWFLDVLDIPFEQALSDANQFVAKDGRLLFIGPANVHRDVEHEQLCREEIVSIFQEKFTECDVWQETLPYLHSPLDAQQRNESVLFVDVRKPVELNTNSIVSPAKRNPSNKRIRHTAEFERYKIENATFFQILSHIEQDMSYRQLADVLERDFGFDPAESEHYVELFIKRLEMDIYRS